MRNASNLLYKDMEIRRDFYCQAEITFADGTVKQLGKDDFAMSGNGFYEGAGSGSFPLGLLIPKHITLSLNNYDDRWSEYDFQWAKVFLKTKFDLSDGTTESINMGNFTVVTPESYGIIVEVTAVDDSYKLDREYETSLTYPASIGSILRDSCLSCGVSLLSQIFTNSDFVVKKKPENITHRQLVGMCAMIAGGNAVLDGNNRLKIIPYDFSELEKSGIDGGVFDTGAPDRYQTGDGLDGGAFSPWISGAAFDGGAFGDRRGIHVLYAFQEGLELETDDVVITGVRLKSGGEEGAFYGKEGYVLSVENVLAEGREVEAVWLIGSAVVGLRFRPFSGSHVPYPMAEFGDPALVIDRKNNVYKTVLTDIGFQYYALTEVSCSADSPIRNSSMYTSEAAKAVISAKKLVEKEKTERERAMEELARELAQSSGLYMTKEEQEDGSGIYYMHDKPTLEESMIIWKLTANAFGISTDGGKTYPYGLDVTGLAILNRIYAIGINCDYLTTGSFEIWKNGKIMVLMDKDTGKVILRPDTFELSNGDTIESIAEKKSQAKLNDFIGAVYDPELARLQAQIDGQIETWYYDHEPTLSNAPASAWKTEAERAKHEGDLFYWKSKGYSYRFFKDGSTWKWQLITDSDITKALSDAAAAQDTADSKRRVFVTTPKPPYDEGDLWAQGAGGDIMTCIASRHSGSYDPSDWKKMNKYIDQSAAEDAASSAVNGQTQEDILNRLTNNGKDTGIYLGEDGKLYISFSAARGDIMILGGANDVNGKMKILNASGNLIGSWGSEGFYTSGKYFAVSEEGEMYSNDPVAVGYLRMAGAVGTYLSTEKADKLKANVLQVAFNTPSTQDTGTYTLRIGDVGTQPGGWSIKKTVLQGDMEVSGDFKVSSSHTKSKEADTENYGKRLLYCYEMPSPLFGDIGLGEIGEDGECAVHLDDIFSETIEPGMEYHVFLQVEGEGDAWVQEKKRTHFLVRGAPGLRFSWEAKAMQKGFGYHRLESSSGLYEGMAYDYESLYMEEIKEIISGREDALYETA